MNYKTKAQAYHSAVSSYDKETIISMVREDYIQHNPKVPTGRSAFTDLLPKLKSHQTKILNVRMFQDNNYVCMHHLWNHALPFGANQMAAFHIIRFDPDGIIAEHWNVMREVASVNPSGRSLLSGVAKISDLEKTDANKRMIENMMLRFTQTNVEKRIDIMRRFFLPHFYQHHPEIEDGISGYKQAVETGLLNIAYKKIHRVFGEGNFVLSVAEGAIDEKPTALYDLFRVENGAISEHWNIYQEIPTAGLLNTNTMFNFQIDRD